MLLLASIPVSSVTGRHAQGLPAQTQSGLSVREAAGLYARGEFDAAARLETSGLMVPQFTRALDAWIAEGDSASAARRKRVAASFALDASWQATRRWSGPVEATNADPWFAEPHDVERWPFTRRRAKPVLVEWALEHLPAPATDPLDRLLTVTSIGFAQDGAAWYRLQDVILPRARKMIGDDPRLRLADVIARTNRDIGTLRPFLTSPGPYLGALRDEQTTAGTIRKIGNAIAAFTPLLADPALTAEVELRIGYLELRRRQWNAALTRFEAARLKSSEPVWRATADYFAGWVHEQLGQTDEAVVAYRRAHAITPLMRNLTTRLAALLYLRGERSESHELLDAALNARPAPIDLMFVFERADARFVPEQLAAIRKALER